MLACFIERISLINLDDRLALAVLPASIVRSFARSFASYNLPISLLARATKVYQTAKVATTTAAAVVGTSGQVKPVTFARFEILERIKNGDAFCEKNTWFTS